MELFAEAAAAPPDQKSGVDIITGGSHPMVVDRLPEQFRRQTRAPEPTPATRGSSSKTMASTTARCTLKARSSPASRKLAQRTGRIDEYKEKLDLILEKLPGTPYAARAEKWKDQPEFAARNRSTYRLDRPAGQRDESRAS